MELTKKELLKHVPVEWKELRNLIESKNNHYEDSYAGKDLLVIDEMDFNGKQFLITVNVEDGELLFVDDLVHFDKVSNSSDKNLDYNEWNSRQEKLLKETEKTGFTLRSANNGGNDDYLWYELAIQADQFTIEKLEQATKLWVHYNKMTRSLLSQ